MAQKLMTTGGAYAHYFAYFADCPCCGGKLSLTCRIIGNLAEVKAEHWGTESSVLPPLSGAMVGLPADPNALLTDDEREQMNVDLERMARQRRLT